VDHGRDPGRCLSTALRRDDVNLSQARLWVRRLKNGLSVEHPIPGDELRFIRRYLATRTDRLPWLFLSERGQPLSRKSVYYLVSTAAQSAGLQHAHPHTLRHSCGYHLADKGTDLRTMQDYLGHRDPRHTVHYSRITGRRFEGLWEVTRHGLVPERTPSWLSHPGYRAA
jgi:type 1 fimbriae regulatory protein FimB